MKPSRVFIIKVLLTGKSFFLIMHQQMKAQKLPKALIKEMEEYEYPNNWDEVQPNDRTRILGDQFYNKGKCIGLKVKSRHSSSACGNVLLNPNHPDFSKLVSIKEVKL